MSRQFTVEWQLEPIELGRRYQKWSDELIRRVKRLMREAAPEAELHMKATAPWTDQTGQARQLLMAVTTEEGEEIVLTLIHGAAYGIWLELRHGGRYAVIVPTTVEFAGRIQQRLAGIMDGL